MNAKELIAALIPHFTGNNDQNIFVPKIEVIKDNILKNGRSVWALRHRGVDTELHLDAAPHIYREMMVQYNAVRSGLRNLGHDPESFGLTETFLFDEAIDKVLDSARKSCKDAEGVNEYWGICERLQRMLQQLSSFGISPESNKYVATEQLIKEIQEIPMTVVREYVVLVSESLELRQKIAAGDFTRKMEDRLVGISVYIYRNEEQMMAFVRRLSEIDRLRLIGGNSLYEFHLAVLAAGKRYETKADKERREQAEEAVKKMEIQRLEEERLAEEERELWRKVAKVECQHRYGHDNAVLSIDYNPDGHFYAGQDETEWLVWPDHNTGDPGVSAPKNDARCLCHWHRLSDGRYIPRKYSNTQAA